MKIARKCLAVAVATLFLPQMLYAEPVRLIVTHLEPPLVPNSVMDLADELGYFEREGVDVELVRVEQTPSALAALQAGEGDIANVSLSALLQLHVQGVDDIVAIASPNKSLPFLIAAKKEIATPADLEGKIFGVGRVGSLDYSLSQSVLAARNVSFDRLQVQVLGQPTVRGQALAAGRVDATTMSIGVWLALPDHSGLHVLVDQQQYYAAAPVVNKVNVVTKAVLAEKRDDVEAAQRALVRISRDFQADPAAWVTAMEPLVSISRDKLEELAPSFDRSWSVNGGLSAPELQYSLEWLYEGADFADAPLVDLTQWADFSVMDAVLEDLGTDDAGDVPGR